MAVVSMAVSAEPVSVAGAGAVVVGTVVAGDGADPPWWGLALALDLPVLPRGVPAGAMARVGAMLAGMAARDGGASGQVGAGALCL
jgi:hypothetical protein